EAHSAHVVFDRLRETRIRFEDDSLMGVVEEEFELLKDLGANESLILQRRRAAPGIARECRNRPVDRVAAEFERPDSSDRSLAVAADAGADRRQDRLAIGPQQSLLVD